MKKYNIATLPNGLRIIHLPSLLQDRVMRNMVKRVLPIFAST